MKIIDIIETFIPGDWGNSELSENTPNAVYCIRGADIVAIQNNDFKNIPLRYISNESLNNKTLKEGDIIIEKSGGSPTQSTGRVVYISKELIEAKGQIVCSNFCTAFRVKQEWNSYFVYKYWQYIYNANIFFNFEGKTSGIKNLQLDIALSSISIEPYSIDRQFQIVSVLSSFEKKMAINHLINQNLFKWGRIKSAPLLA